MNYNFTTIDFDVFMDYVDQGGYQIAIESNPTVPFVKNHNTIRKALLTYEFDESDINHIWKFHGNKENFDSCWEIGLMDEPKSWFEIGATDPSKLLNFIKKALFRPSTIDNIVEQAMRIHGSVGNIEVDVLYDHPIGLIQPVSKSTKTECYAAHLSLKMSDISLMNTNDRNKKNSHKKKNKKLTGRYQLVLKTAYPVR